MNFVVCDVKKISRWYLLAKRVRTTGLKLPSNLTTILPIHQSYLSAFRERFKPCLPLDLPSAQLTPVIGYKVL